jgi:hypothetical protein
MTTPVRNRHQNQNCCQIWLVSFLNRYHAADGSDSEFKLLIGDGAVRVVLHVPDSESSSNNF